MKVSEISDKILLTNQEAHLASTAARIARDHWQEALDKEPDGTTMHHMFAQERDKYVKLHEDFEELIG